MRKIIVLVIFAVSLNLFGQYEYKWHPFESEIIDSRAEALGKTKLLSTSNANNVFNNPALLPMAAQYVQLSQRFSMGSIKQEIDHDEIEDYRERYEPSYKFNGAAISIPLQIPQTDQIKFAAGAGYRTIYDYGFNHLHEFSSEEENEAGEIETVDYEERFSSKGGLNQLVLAFGVNFYEKVAFGISSSNSIFSKIKVEIESEYDDTENTEYEQKISGDFIDFNLTYNYSATASFSVNYRSPFEYSYKFIGDDYDDNINYNVSIPAEISLASCIGINEWVKVFAEYSNRNLDKYKLNGQYIYPKTKNGSAFHLGAEISHTIIYRGGIYLRNVPIYRNNDADVKEIDPLQEVGFTGGVGINLFSKISLDFFGTYKFVHFQDQFHQYNQAIHVDYNEKHFLFGTSISYQI